MTEQNRNQDTLMAVLGLSLLANQIVSSIEKGADLVIPLEALEGVLGMVDVTRERLIEELYAVNKSWLAATGSSWASGDPSLN